MWLNSLSVNGARSRFMVTNTALASAALLSADSPTKLDSTGAVFFGDRPLNNPGYSAMQLKGEVGVGKTNMVLDVLKIEQRLKYLGYSSFEKTHNNVTKEFFVDGKWSSPEDTALRGFYVATNYTTAAYWGGFGYEATASAKPEARVVKSGTTNLNWLNAFNAPHMIDMYSALPIPRTDTKTIVNRFQNGAGKIEAFSTSWVYDWLQAWRQSQDGFDRLPEAQRAKVLDTDYTRINGLTSPSGYKANGQHESGGHSSLMAVDWGLKDVIEDQGETQFNNTTITLTAADRTWSVANAIALADKLNENDSPGEKKALKKFLSLYSLTRDDGSPNDANGGWEDIAVRNGSVVKQAIFGSGDGSPIQAVFLGMDGKRTYPNMREIIKALGLQNIKPSGGDHHTHFHIDFRTPDPVDIGGGRMLQADSPPNPETRNEIGEDPMRLLEILMAAAMAQAQPAPASAPAVQVAAASVATKTNYVAGLCRAEDPYAGTSEWGQNRVIGVELTAMRYVREQLKRDADRPLASSVKVEKHPQNGKLDIGYAQPGNIEQGDTKYWRYTPNPGYEHGNDHATFLVDVQGTPVRVVVVLKVRQQKGSDAQWAEICPSGYQVISNGLGSDELLSTWERQSALSAVLADAANTVIGFQNLSGSAVGNTVGEGSNAQITLDTNAAGHGWYVDATPLDNTDDYLPTSNPNVWQAKAGSAAAGKMDMLSVLLHEYGHALGLERSADGSDAPNTPDFPGMPLGGLAGLGWFAM